LNFTSFAILGILQQSYLKINVKMAAYIPIAKARGFTPLFDKKANRRFNANDKFFTSKSRINLRFFRTYLQDKW